MKTPFFRIRDQAFHIFKGAGNFGLAMSLQHRNINEKINVLYAGADMKLHSPTVCRIAFVLLCVMKDYSVLITESVISAGIEGIHGFISHPGTLHQRQISEPSFLKIFNNACQNLSVGGCPVRRMRRGNHIGLDSDTKSFISNLLCQPAFFQNPFCHFLILCSTCYKNLIFFHKCRSSCNR